MKILETNNLLIREFLHEDIPLFMEYSQESGKRTHLPDEVFETIDQATAQIDTYISHYAKKTYPQVYAIVLKESNRLIGDILLTPFGKDIEIGYSISERYQGNGYGAESIKAFTEWAKETIQDIGILYGVVKQTNIASWKSLEKAGFIFSTEKELNYFGEGFTFRIYTY